MFDRLGIPQRIRSMAHALSVSLVALCLLIALGDIGAKTPLGTDAPREKKLWDGLGNHESKVGLQVMKSLLKSPDLAVKIIGNHLRPASENRIGSIQKLINQLDSKRYVARAQATLALKRLGSTARPQLLLAKEENISLEVRLRIEDLLSNLQNRANPSEIQRNRAFEILEQLASAPAPFPGRKHLAHLLLRKLSKIETDRWLAQQAKAALVRVEKARSLPQLPAQILQVASLNGHTGAIYAVDISPDGKYLASVGSDTTVRLWDMKTHKLLRVIQGHTRSIWSVKFTRDGKEVVSASSDQTIRFHDVETGTLTRIFKGHTGSVYALAMSPDGTLMASSGQDQTVRVWRLSTEQLVSTYRGHTGSIWTINFNHDGTRLASGSYDRTVIVWRLDTNEQEMVLQGHSTNVRAVAFSPDGRTLVSTSSQGTVRLWELITKGVRWTFPGHTQSVRGLEFRPYGRTFATASSDKTVRVWNSYTGTNVAVLRGHSQYARAVAFSPDGKWLASASYDRTIKLWRLFDPKKEKQE
ncbi:MAG: WD40 repeat domain-containing protein [Gemmataceae bacterium]